jgi:hypothetical protein
MFRYLDSPTHLLDPISVLIVPWYVGAISDQYVSALYENRETGSESGKGADPHVLTFLVECGPRTHPSDRQATEN